MKNTEAAAAEPLLRLAGQGDCSRCHETAVLFQITGDREPGAYCRSCATLGAEIVAQRTAPVAQVRLSDSNASAQDLLEMKRASDAAEAQNALAFLHSLIDDAGSSPVEHGAVIRLRDELLRLARISKADFESCARRAAEVSR